MSKAPPLAQIVTLIVMPLSRSGIAVVWFFSFTSAWNEFLLPLIFARTDTAFPMSVGLFAAFGEHGVGRLRLPRRLFADLRRLPRSRCTSCCGATSTPALPASA